MARATMPIFSPSCGSTRTIAGPPVMRMRSCSVPAIVCGSCLFSASLPYSQRKMKPQVVVSMNAELAQRIRSILAANQGLAANEGSAANKGVVEKPMFGGICFMVNGNMAVAARRNASLLARVGGKEAEQALTEPGVERMVM
ncbi:MAG: hypothetical protein EPN45_15205, partial [Rhizobiaceae bacterium]